MLEAASTDHFAPIIERNPFFIALIEEASQIPIDSIPDIAVLNAREVGTDVTEIRRGERNINGNRFTFIEYGGSVSGFDVTFLGLFYSDASGTLQIVGWSTSNIFEDTRGKIERFASGFFLTPQGGAARSSGRATELVACEQNNETETATMSLMRTYRAALTLSQSAFAARLNVPLETYRTWDSASRTGSRR